MMVEKNRYPVFAAIRDFFSKGFRPRRLKLLYCGALFGSGNGL